MGVGCSGKQNGCFGRNHEITAGSLRCVMRASGYSYTVCSYTHPLPKKFRVHDSSEFTASWPWFRVHGSRSGSPGTDTGGVRGVDAQQRRRRGTGVVLASTSVCKLQCLSTATLSRHRAILGCISATSANDLPGRGTTLHVGHAAVRETQSSVWRWHASHRAATTQAPCIVSVVL